MPYLPIGARGAALTIGRTVRASQARGLRARGLLVTPSAVDRFADVGKRPWALEVGSLPEVREVFGHRGDDPRRVVGLEQSRVDALARSASGLSVDAYRRGEAVVDEVVKV